MKIKKLIASCIAGLVIATHTGCLVVAAVGLGAGAVKFYNGDLEVESAKTFDEVFAAVEQSCKELNFEIQKIIQSTYY